MLEGNGYQLGVNSAGTGLYRNNSGAVFPYNFGSLASIIGTNASPGYYYFFYDSTQLALISHLDIQDLAYHPHLYIFLIHVP